MTPSLHDQAQEIAAARKAREEKRTRKIASTPAPVDNFRPLGDIVSDLMAKLVVKI